MFFGGSGAGKTTLALKFPKPALLDLEGGADLYGGRFDFGVLRATKCDEITAAVDWIAAHPSEFETVIVDPITVYWDALQRKWSEVFLLRNRGAKGHRHEFYELGPKEWMTIKADWREFLRKLLALDAHVIVTAREKPEYADTGFMRQTGTTFDGEKSLPYLFDVVMRQYRDAEGRYLAQVIKDRTGCLPTEPFEPKIEIFHALLAPAGEGSSQEA